MKSTKVIGLYGDIGAGKDSVANFLCAAGGSKRAFGDFLREELMLAYPDLFAHKLINTQDRKRKELPDMALAARHIDQEMPDLAEIIAHQALLKYGLGSWLTAKQIPVSPRDVLRWYGSEYRRTLFGEDYWLTKMEEWVDRHEPGFLVVPDVRTPIEFDWVCKYGALVHVERPGNPYAEVMSQHSSDTPVPSVVHALITNDSDLFVLGRQTLYYVGDLL